MSTKIREWCMWRTHEGPELVEKSYRDKVQEMLAWMHLMALDSGARSTTLEAFAKLDPRTEPAWMAARRALTWLPRESFKTTS
jgi:hypothetical protein